MFFSWRNLCCRTIRTRAKVLVLYWTENKHSQRLCILQVIHAHTILLQDHLNKNKRNQQLLMIEKKIDDILQHWRSRIGLEKKQVVSNICFPLCGFFLRLTKNTTPSFLFMSTTCSVAFSFAWPRKLHSHAFVCDL